MLIKIIFRVKTFMLEKVSLNLQSSTYHLFVRGKVLFFHGLSFQYVKENGGNKGKVLLNSKWGPATCHHPLGKIPEAKVW